VGTAFLALATAIVAAVFTGNMLTVHRQTLVATGRPWLGVTQVAPSVHGPNASTSLDFADRGAEFGLQYTLRNYRKSPAQRSSRT
jgi:hypothetical protein